MSKCFLIKADLEQNIDGIMNVHLLNKLDADLKHFLNSDKRTFTQKKVTALANLSNVLEFDFIANDLRIPIFSNRFKNVISLKNCIDYDLIPITLLDDTFQEEYFNAQGNLNENVKTITTFYTINFKNRKDFCHKEKSEIRIVKSNPNSKGILNKAVLNYPESGFPDFFRLNESISMLFVSQKVKEKIEENEIKGCLFEEVEVANLKPESKNQNRLKVNEKMTENKMWTWWTRNHLSNVFNNENWQAYETKVNESQAPFFVNVNKAKGFFKAIEQFNGFDKDVLMYMAFLIGGVTFDKARKKGFLEMYKLTFEEWLNAKNWDNPNKPNPNQLTLTQLSKTENGNNYMREKLGSLIVFDEKRRNI